MNIDITINPEILSTVDEKTIYFHYYEEIKTNSYTYNNDDMLKNYVLNYNLYIFYTQFRDLMLRKTKIDIHNIRKSLLKTQLLSRLNTYSIFFHNRMLQTKPQNLNSKNNNILGCI